MKFTGKEYDELGEYVDLEGTEIGCYLIQLMDIWQVPESHGKNPDFDRAIDIELWHWLNRFKAEATIHECSEPRPDRVWKELEWG